MTGIPPTPAVRRRRRRTVAGGIILATAVALVGSTVGAAAEALPSDPVATSVPAADRSAPELDWTDCERDEPEAAGSECATLQVPVDWQDPDGPTFGLALARRAAKSPDTRIGAIVFGPGGPGDSGVDRIRTGISRFSPDLQRRFDIVSFDPRGIAGSNAVVCSSDLLARKPSPIVRSQAEFDTTVAYNRELAADCRAHTGPVYDHLDTLNTVHDLDAIRAALGEERLTFHGSSYGTMLGGQYAEVYPDRVRAIVLESVSDHSLGTRQFLDTQAVAAQDSFDEFVAWCDRTPGCALHGEDIRALWAGLLTRADRGELPDPEHPGVGFTPFTLSFTVFRTFYDPDWAELAQLLATLRDSGSTATAVPSEEATAVPSEGASAETRPFEFAVFCQDWDLPVRTYREYAAHQHRLARIAPEMKYPGALLAVSTCLGSPPADNPQHRLKVDDPSTRLLLTNAVHDPATGYNWATNVARQLGRDAVLLTYEGWGHGTYNSTPCAQRLIDRYLMSQTLPDRGTRCAAVEPAAVEPPG